jgi:cell wall-associated NlpC family hydrolase
MNKLTCILSLSILIQPCLFMDAQAIKTAHRPWGARRKASSLDLVESNMKTIDSVTRHHGHAKHAVKGDRIVKQAIRYEGTRYKFGGDSKSKGFDCSGLVRRIYNDLNIDKLPHSAAGLYKMGNPVHMNDLRAGDLVFFKNTYRKGISHVGVYAGSNRFIHAQNRRNGVTMTSLADPYFQLHYAGARRLY